MKLLQVSGVLTGEDQEVIIMCKPSNQNHILNDDYNDIEDSAPTVKTKTVGQTNDNKVKYELSLYQHREEEQADVDVDAIVSLGKPSEF